MFRCLLLVACTLIALVSPSARADYQPIPAEIEKILALPEDKIDIGIAALTFAHAVFPDYIDIKAHSKTIDQLAKEARSLAGAKAGPDKKRVAISTVITREGFQYDFTPGAKTAIQTYFLPGLLQSKLGMCATMPMLYMAVAQRAGLPVYAVAAPAHSFLRVTDPHATSPLIEATSGGSTATDADYIKKFNVSDRAIEQGVYMRTMTHHEYLAVLLSINGSHYWRMGDVDKAMAYYARAEEIDPRSDGAALGLMIGYMRKAEIAAAKFGQYAEDEYFDQVKEYTEKAGYWRDKAKWMGIRWEDYARANDE